MIMNPTFEPMRHPAGLLARFGKTGPRPSTGFFVNPLAPGGIHTVPDTTKL